MKGIYLQERVRSGGKYDFSAMYYRFLLKKEQSQQLKLAECFAGLGFK